jgi:hypothetical protein
VERGEYSVTKSDLALMADVVESRIVLRLEREKTDRMFAWLKTLNIALLIGAAIVWVVGLSR